MTLDEITYAVTKILMAKNLNIYFDEDIDNITYKYNMTLNDFLVQLLWAVQNNKSIFIKYFENNNLTLFINN